MYRGMQQCPLQRQSLGALTHPARHRQPSCPRPPSPRLDHHPRCYNILLKNCAFRSTPCIAAPNRFCNARLTALYAFAAGVLPAWRPL